MNVILFKLTLLLYLAATAGYLVYIISQQRPAARVALGVAIAGFFLHTATIVVRYYEAGYAPVTNLHESLSFFAWALIGSYLYIHQRYKVKNLGAFATPIAALSMIASSTLPKKIIALPPALKSYWLPIHATVCFLAYGILAVAACAGIMYLIQERQIKKKKLGALYQRLPSLEVLDAINYRCLTIGFPLLTVGILTGSLWAEQAWGAHWQWDPKETWSLVTWLFYAALLHERLTVGWRGRRAAIMAIIGLGALLFTFLGVSLLLKGLHTYAGWGV